MKTRTADKDKVSSKRKKFYEITSSLNFEQILLKTTTPQFYEF